MIPLTGAPPPPVKNSEARKAYYDQLAEHNLAPLWERLGGLIPRTPQPSARPAGPSSLRGRGACAFAGGGRDGRMSGCPAFSEGNGHGLGAHGPRRFLLQQKPFARPRCQLERKMTAQNLGLAPAEKCLCRAIPSGNFLFGIDGNDGDIIGDGERPAVAHHQIAGVTADARCVPIHQDSSGGGDQHNRETPCDSGDSGSASPH